MNTLIFTPDGPWTLRDLKGQPGGGLVLMAERGGKEAGRMVLQRQNAFWGELGGEATTWVQELEVQSEFRHRGLGKALLKFSEAQAAAQRSVFLRLDIDAADKRLQAWLAKFGFQALGTKDRDGKSVRLMEKLIK